MTMRSFMTMRSSGYGANRSRGAVDLDAPPDGRAGRLRLWNAAAWALSASLGLGSGLAGCGPAPQSSTPPAPLAGAVLIDGSSTVAPVCQAAAEEFARRHAEVKTTVRVSGTGGGFKKFVKGETDAATASRPIRRDELDEAAANGAEFIELPLCFDALTVVVHPENDWVDHFTVAELKTMWAPESAGKILRWSDVRAGWPDEKFELYGPGRDSGTFDYFTEAVVGKPGKSRDDYVAAEDDNRLVRGVAGGKYAVGYFGYAYYAAYKDRLKAVAIRGDGAAAAVAPGEDGIRSGAYTPLSRPLFVYVSKKSAERPEVAAFVTYFLSNAGDFARRKKYVPLSSQLYEALGRRFEQRRTGTAFGGANAVGLSMEELGRREPK